MTPELIAAAQRLAEVLQAENTALAAFDLPGVAGLLAEKAAALDGFETTRALARQGSVGTLSVAQRQLAEALTVQLRQLVEQNRILLERAMFVQNRVISIFARAMPRALAAETSRYGANGSWAGNRTPPPLTLRSRV